MWPMDGTQVTDRMQPSLVSGRLIFTVQEDRELQEVLLHSNLDFNTAIKKKTFSKCFINHIYQSLSLVHLMDKGLLW